MSENLLKMKDLSIELRTYDGVVRVINHMSFDVPKGKAVEFVGEAGAGKTTTALSVMGLIPNPPGVITSGSILFEGTDLLKLNESAMCQYRGKKIGMIFQSPMTSLNPVYIVEHQISDIIEQHQNIDQKETWKRAGDMLEIVGISRKCLTNYPHEFSGGMKQRVRITMGLSYNPQLLIADEPTTALDVTIQAQILELMKGSKEKYKTPTILITHVLGVVAEIADYAVVVYAGCVIEKGAIQEVFKQPSHLYTQGLFGCLPDTESEESVMLRIIRGFMPDPMDLPAGCKFCPRCDKAMDIYKTTDPKDMSIGGEHTVKCHLCGEEELV